MNFGAFAIKAPGSETWVAAGGSYTLTANAEGNILGSFADIDGLFSDNVGFMQVYVTGEGEAHPPTAVAYSVTPPIMVAGGSAVIDSFQSTVNPEVPERTIASYTWTFFNMTTPETLPLIASGSDSWVEAMLDEPGEYSVTLTVTDSVGEQSSGDDSMAHVQFTVVGGSFAPSALTVAPGGTVTTTVTVTPSSAFNLVTLAPAPGDEGKLSVTPTTLTSASQTVTITAGMEPGPYRIVAQIGEGGYYQTAGSADVKIESQKLTLSPSGKTVVPKHDGTGLSYVTFTATTASGAEVSIKLDDSSWQTQTTSVSLDVPTTSAGEFTITAKDATGQLQATLVVVELEAIESPSGDRLLGIIEDILPDGTRTANTPQATVTGRTYPEGYGSLIKWKVTPEGGANPSEMTGASWEGTFSRVETFEVKGTLGGTSKSRNFTVFSVSTPNKECTRADREGLHATLARVSSEAVVSYTWTFIKQALPTDKISTKMTDGPNTTVVLVDDVNPLKVRVRATLPNEDDAPFAEGVAVLTVVPRNGWVVPIDFASDNEKNWGTLPTTTTRQFFGQNRDRKSDAPDAIFTPSVPAGGRWEDGYKTAQVKDIGGPDNGYWYVKSSTFRIDRESVINQYIKKNGPAPEHRQPNWFRYNSNTILSPSAQPFVDACINHEGMGSGGESTGHQSLIIRFEKGNRDVREELETYFNSTSDQGITISANRFVEATSSRIYAASALEANVTGNWPEGTRLYFWDSDLQQYGLTPMRGF
jgi:plastocyanin